LTDCLRIRSTRAGCVLHDAGKALHPGELTGSGNAHEADGEALLLSHGADPRIARICRSHAQWRELPCSLEELVVAVSDCTWKGKRVAELEARLVGAVVERTGRHRWEVFVAVDDACERIAEGASARLARSLRV
jgi:hypothetical protein